MLGSWRLLSEPCRFDTWECLWWIVGFVLETGSRSWKKLRRDWEAGGHASSRGGGGRLVLLKAVLSAIPTYFMAIFRMPAGVRRRIESVMQGFFWRSSRQEGSRGVALVAWETVCRPVSQGGLGVPHFQHVNIALLTKWVARLMQPSGDMVAAILRDGYGASLDWQIWQIPRKGNSAFMSSLRPIFKTVQPFFRPKLGTGESFRFWADE